MGFTPQEVDAMSVWQFVCCLEGHRKANDPKSASEPTSDIGEDRLRELGIVGF